MTPDHDSSKSTQIVVILLFVGFAIAEHVLIHTNVQESLLDTYLKADRRLSCHACAA